LVFSNASMRGDCLGANLNGGQAGGLSTSVRFLGSQYVVIWGPTLNQFGLSGLPSFTWTVTVDGVVAATGSGEMAQTFTHSGTGLGLIVVTVMASDPNEQGTVLIQSSN